MAKNTCGFSAPHGMVISMISDILVLKAPGAALRIASVVGSLEVGWGVMFTSIVVAPFLKEIKNVFSAGKLFCCLFVGS